MRVKKYEFTSAPPGGGAVGAPVPLGAPGGAGCPFFTIGLIDDWLRRAEAMIGAFIGIWPDNCMALY